MENNPFFEDLAAILEVEPGELQPDFVLNQENWNSLSIVSTIVLIDEYFSIAIPGENLRECKSLGELWQLIKDATNSPG